MYSWSYMSTQFLKRTISLGIFASSLFCKFSAKPSWSTMVAYSSNMVSSTCFTITFPSTIPSSCTGSRLYTYIHQRHLATRLMAYQVLGAISTALPFRFVLPMYPDYMYKHIKSRFFTHFVCSSYHDLNFANDMDSIWVVNLKKKKRRFMKKKKKNSIWVLNEKKGLCCVYPFNFVNVVQINWHCAWCKISSSTVQIGMWITLNMRFNRDRYHLKVPLILR